MTNASKKRVLMLNDNVWNETWNIHFCERYSFIVQYHHLQPDLELELDPQPQTAKLLMNIDEHKLIVPYLCLRLMSLIRIVDEDFVKLLSRSTAYIRFDNKRPITSASHWLWWPAKFLYREQKPAFKARIHIFLSWSKILAVLVIILKFGKIH